LSQASIFIGFELLTIQCNLRLQLIANRLYIESAHCDLLRTLILSVQRAIAWSHSGNGEVAQRDCVIIVNSQTIRIDMPMGHSIFVEEFQQTQTLVVQESKLFLREYLLTAVALLVELLGVAGGSSRSVEHIDQRAGRKVDEGDVVEHSACVFIDDEDFLVHAREELFFAIIAIVFKELH